MIRPCRKRDKSVFYSLAYGTSVERAFKLFCENKQNRRMPARARKKAFSNLLKLYTICARIK